jgi:hypothetical protein
MFPAIPVVLFAAASVCVLLSAAATVVKCGKLSVSEAAMLSADLLVLVGMVAWAMQSAR